MHDVMDVALVFMARRQRMAGSLLMLRKGFINHDSMVLPHFPQQGHNECKEIKYSRIGMAPSNFLNHSNQ